MLPCLNRFKNLSSCVAHHLRFSTACLLLTPSLLHAGGLAPSLSPIPAQVITPDISESGSNVKTIGAYVDFTLQATDPENEPLSFSISSVKKNGVVLVTPPEKMTIDSTTGHFRWGARTSQIGEYEIVFIVRDCVPAAVGGGCVGNEVSTIGTVSVRRPAVCAGSEAFCTYLKARANDTESSVAGSTGDYYLAGDQNGDSTCTNMTYHASILIDPLPQIDFHDRMKGTDFSLHPSYCTRGAYGAVLPGEVLIGNSSTCSPEAQQCSSTVRANFMRLQSGVDTVYRQYLNNHHMWYPAHLDYNRTETGTVDFYHALLPYVSSSQGSSTSELDEVRKFTRTLAAFKKSVKDRLRSSGLLIPTLQMIFRRTRIDTDAEYLSGKAHPSAFGDAGNEMSMVQMAYGIEPSNIPPIVQIEVLDHNYNGTPGLDFFELKDELLFASPASVAFIYRGRQAQKRIVASAESSYDLNQRPLTYHWAVLRGTQKAQIRPLNSNSSLVEILIDYHPETTVEGTAIKTNRVDIGAFVRNGAYYSAPAFITSYTLNNETRTYAGDQLVETVSSDRYVYDALSTKRPWSKDTYRYGANGEFQGWVRTETTGATRSFDAQGHCESCAGFKVWGALRYRDQYPLAGVTLQLVNSSALEGPYEAVSGPDGSYAFPKVPNGTYQVRARNVPVKYRLSVSQFTMNGIDIQPSNNIFCNTGFLSTGADCEPRFTLSGKVTNLGRDVQGVEIRANLVSSPTIYRTTTDANGNFVVGLPNTGVYEVRASGFFLKLDPSGWSTPYDLTAAPTTRSGLNFSATCREGSWHAHCSSSPPPPARPERLRVVEQ